MEESGIRSSVHGESVTRDRAPS
ncbi:MAG: hypothetical protein R3B96_09550 [Pirellulaceae bacterium]